MFIRDEVDVGMHRRGAIGISTRGCDTGDAQIFINLVDNPRLDHEYTVFAYVQRHPRDHMEIVDTILEGEVITRVEIIETALTARGGGANNSVKMLTGRIDTATRANHFEPYSARRATTGSMRAALRAGR